MSEEENEYLKNAMEFASVARAMYRLTRRNMSYATPIPSSYWKRLHFGYGCHGPTIHYFCVESGLYVFRKDDDSYMFETGSTPLNAYLRAIGAQS